MIVSDVVASAAATFTTNKVCRRSGDRRTKHIANGKLHGIVVNAGNANACTGKQGWRDAQHDVPPGGHRDRLR